MAVLKPRPGPALLPLLLLLLVHSLPTPTWHPRCPFHTLPTKDQALLGIVALAQSEGLPLFVKDSFIRYRSLTWWQFFMWSCENQCYSLLPVKSLLNSVLLTTWDNLVGCVFYHGVQEPFITHLWELSQLSWDRLNGDFCSFCTWVFVSFSSCGKVSVSFTLILRSQYSA